MLWVAELKAPEDAIGIAAGEGHLLVGHSAQCRREGANSPLPCGPGVGTIASMVHVPWAPTEPVVTVFCPRLSPSVLRFQNPAMRTSTARNRILVHVVIEMRRSEHRDRWNMAFPLLTRPVRLLLKATFHLEPLLAGPPMTTPWLPDASEPIMGVPVVGVGAA